MLQRKCPRKEIARIVGISQSTLSCELKQNSTRPGKYIWFKAHDKAMKRRKRSTRNATLTPELVCRTKQIIIKLQWSPRQISGVLKKEGVSVSHQCIYNMIHADASGELARHPRHKLKYRRRQKHYSAHFVLHCPNTGRGARIHHSAVQGRRAQRARACVRVRHFSFFSFTLHPKKTNN